MGPGDPCPPKQHCWECSYQSSRHTRVYVCSFSAPRLVRGYKEEKVPETAHLVSFRIMLVACYYYY